MAGDEDEPVKKPPAPADDTSDEELEEPARRVTRLQAELDQTNKSLDAMREELRGMRMGQSRPSHASSLELDQPLPEASRRFYESLGYSARDTGDPACPMGTQGGPAPSAPPLPQDPSVPCAPLGTFTGTDQAHTTGPQAQGHGMTDPGAHPMAGPSTVPTGPDAQHPSWGQGPFQSYGYSGYNVPPQPPGGFQPGSSYYPNAGTDQKGSWRAPGGYSFFPGAPPGAYPSGFGTSFPGTAFGGPPFPGAPPPSGPFSGSFSAGTQVPPHTNPNMGTQSNPPASGVPLGTQTNLGAGVGSQPMGGVPQGSQGSAPFAPTSAVNTVLQKALLKATPPTYHGKPGTLQPWISFMVNYLGQLNISERDATKFLRLYCRDKAIEYLLRQDPQSIRTSNETIRLLMDHFEHMDEASADRDFNSIYQRKEESVASVCDRLELALDRAYPNMHYDSVLFGRQLKSRLEQVMHPQLIDKIPTWDLRELPYTEIRTRLQDEEARMAAANNQAPPRRVTSGPIVPAAQTIRTTAVPHKGILKNNVRFVNAMNVTEDAGATYACDALSLDAQPKEIIQAVNTVEADQADLATVMGNLAQQMATVSSVIEDHPVLNELHGKTPLAARDIRSRTRSTTVNEGPGLCWNCKQPGHVKNDCKNPPKCDFCGVEGHTKYNCREHAKRYGQSPQTHGMQTTFAYPPQPVYAQAPVPQYSQAPVPQFPVQAPVYPPVQPVQVPVYPPAQPQYVVPPAQWVTPPVASMTPHYEVVQAPLQWAEGPRNELTQETAAELRQLSQALGPMTLREGHPLYGQINSENNNVNHYQAYEEAAQQAGLAYRATVGALSTPSFSFGALSISADYRGSPKPQEDPPVLLEPEEPTYMTFTYYYPSSTDPSAGGGNSMAEDTAENSSATEKVKEVIASGAPQIFTKKVKKIMIYNGVTTEIPVTQTLEDPTEDAKKASSAKCKCKYCGGAEHQKSTKPFFNVPNMMWLGIIICLHQVGTAGAEFLKTGSSLSGLGFQPLMEAMETIQFPAGARPAIEQAQGFLRALDPDNKDANETSLPRRVVRAIRPVIRMTLKVKARTGALPAECHPHRTQEACVFAKVWDQTAPLLKAMGHLKEARMAQMQRRVMTPRRLEALLEMVSHPTASLAQRSKRQIPGLSTIAIPVMVGVTVTSVISAVAALVVATQQMVKYKLESKRLNRELAELILVQRDLTQLVIRSAQLKLNATRERIPLPRIEALMQQQKATALKRVQKRPTTGARQRRTNKNKRRARLAESQSEPGSEILPSRASRHKGRIKRSHRVRRRVTRSGRPRRKKRFAAPLVAVPLALATATTVGTAAAWVWFQTQEELEYQDALVNATFSLAETLHEAYAKLEIVYTGERTRGRREATQKVALTPLFPAQACKLAAKDRQVRSLLSRQKRFWPALLPLAAAAGGATFTLTRHMFEVGAAVVEDTSMFVDVTRMRGEALNITAFYHEAKFELQRMRRPFEAIDAYYYRELARRRVTSKAFLPDPDVLMGDLQRQMEQLEGTPQTPAKSPAGLFDPEAHAPTQALTREKRVIPVPALLAIIAVATGATAAAVTTGVLLAEQKKQQAKLKRELARLNAAHQILQEQAWHISEDQRHLRSQFSIQFGDLQHPMFDDLPDYEYYSDYNGTEVPSPPERSPSDPSRDPESAEGFPYRQRRSAEDDFPLPECMETLEDYPQYGPPPTSGSRPKDPSMRWFRGMTMVAAVLRPGRLGPMVLFFLACQSLASGVEATMAAPDSIPRQPPRTRAVSPAASSPMIAMTVAAVLASLPTMSAKGHPPRSEGPSSPLLFVKETVWKEAMKETSTVPGPVPPQSQRNVTPLLNSLVLTMGLAAALSHPALLRSEPPLRPKRQTRHVAPTMKEAWENTRLLIQQVCSQYPRRCKQQGLSVDTLGEIENSPVQRIKRAVTVHKRLKRVVTMSSGVTLVTPSPSQRRMIELMRGLIRTQKEQDRLKQKQEMITATQEDTRRLVEQVCSQCPRRCARAGLSAGTTEPPGTDPRRKVKKTTKLLRRLKRVLIGGPVGWPRPPPIAQLQAELEQAEKAHAWHQQLIAQDAHVELQRRLAELTRRQDELLRDRFREVVGLEALEALKRANVTRSEQPSSQLARETAWLHLVLAQGSVYGLLPFLASSEAAARNLTRQKRAMALHGTPALHDPNVRATLKQYLGWLKQKANDTPTESLLEAADRSRNPNGTRLTATHSPHILRPGLKPFGTNGTQDNGTATAIPFVPTREQQQVYERLRLVLEEDLRHLTHRLKALAETRGRHEDVESVQPVHSTAPPLRIFGGQWLPVILFLVTLALGQRGESAVVLLFTMSLYTDYPKAQAAKPQMKTHDLIKAAQEAAEQLRRIEELRGRAPPEVMLFERPSNTGPRDHDRMRPPLAGFAEDDFQLKTFARHKPLTELVRTVPSTPTQQVMKQGQIELGTKVNLAIGAAMVPHRVALLNPTTTWLSFIVEMVAPHWLPVSLRHPKAEEACKDVEGAHLQECQELMDPHKARKECPHTRAIQKVTNSLLGEVAARYRMSMDVTLNAQVFKHICATHTQLCAQIEEAMDEADKQAKAKRSTTHRGTMRILNRRRRFAVATVLAVISGIIAAGTAFSSAGLSTQITELRKDMAKYPPRFRALRNGVEANMANIQNLTALTSDGFDQVYEVIEAVRCQTVLGIEEVQLVLMASSYRNYLTTMFDNIVDMARTGRVSPTLLGADRLTAIINAEPTLRHSLLASEPHLFYDFARGFTVQLDFQGFRFGFLVEVPLPRPDDAHLAFQIHNVGFHAGPPLTSNDKGQRTVVHRARLPEAVILRHDDALVPLDVTQCRSAASMYLCPSRALYSQDEFPCLKLLSDPRCVKACEASDTCASDISVALQHAVPEVANTRAGILARAPRGEVAAYFTKPSLRSSTELPKPQQVSQALTSFVTGAFLVVVDGVNVNPLVLGPVLKALMLTTPPVNVSAPNVVRGHATSWMQFARGLENNRRTLVVEFRHAFEDQKYHTSLAIGGAWVASALALFLMLCAILLSCYCCGYCDKLIALPCLARWQSQLEYQPIPAVEVDYSQFVRRDENLCSLITSKNLAKKLRKIHEEIPTSPVPNSMLDPPTFSGYHRGPASDARKDRADPTEEDLGWDTSHLTRDPPAAVDPSSSEGHNAPVPPPAEEAPAPEGNDLQNPIPGEAVTGLSEPLDGQGPPQEETSPQPEQAELDSPPTTDEDTAYIYIKVPDPMGPSLAKISWHSLDLTKDQRAMLHALQGTGRRIPRGTNVPRAVFSEPIQGRIQELSDKFPQLYDDTRTDGVIGLTTGSTCVSVVVLVDTGAAVTIITNTTALLLEAAIHPLSDALKTCVESATGHRVVMQGYAKPALYLAGVLYLHPVFVRAPVEGEGRNPHAISMVIGNDLLEKIGELHIDYIRRSLTFADPVKKIKFRYAIHPKDDQVILRSTGGFSIGERRKTGRDYHANLPPGAFTGKDARQKLAEQAAQKAAAAKRATAAAPRVQPAPSATPIPLPPPTAVLPRAPPGPQPRPPLPQLVNLPPGFTQPPAARRSVRVRTPTQPFDPTRSPQSLPPPAVPVSDPLAGGAGPSAAPVTALTAPPGNVVPLADLMRDVVSQMAAIQVAQHNGDSHVNLSEYWSAPSEMDLSMGSWSTISNMDIPASISPDPEGEYDALNDHLEDPETTMATIAAYASQAAQEDEAPEVSTVAEQKEQTGGVPSMGMRAVRPPAPPENIRIMVRHPAPSGPLTPNWRYTHGVYCYAQKLPHFRVPQEVQGRYIFKAVYKMLNCERLMGFDDHDPDDINGIFNRMTQPELSLYRNAVPPPHQLTDAYDLLAPVLSAAGQEVAYMVTQMVGDAARRELMFVHLEHPITYGRPPPSHMRPAIDNSPALPGPITIPPYPEVLRNMQDMVSMANQTIQETGHTGPLRIQMAIYLHGTQNRSTAVILAVMTAHTARRRGLEQQFLPRGRPVVVNYYVQQATVTVTAEAGDSHTEEGPDILMNTLQRYTIREIALMIPQEQARLRGAVLHDADITAIEMFISALTPRHVGFNETIPTTFRPMQDGELHQSSPPAVQHPVESIPNLLLIFRPYREDPEAEGSQPPAPTIPTAPSATPSLVNAEPGAHAGASRYPFGHPEPMDQQGPSGPRTGTYRNGVFRLPQLGVIVEGVAIEINLKGEAQRLATAQAAVPLGEALAGRPSMSTQSSIDSATSQDMSIRRIRIVDPPSDVATNLRVHQQAMQCFVQRCELTSLPNTLVDFYGVKAVYSPLYIMEERGTRVSAYARSDVQFLQGLARMAQQFESVPYPEVVMARTSGDDPTYPAERLSPLWMASTTSVTRILCLQIKNPRLIDLVFVTLKQALPLRSPRVDELTPSPSQRPRETLPRGGPHPLLSIRALAEQTGLYQTLEYPLLGTLEMTDPSGTLILAFGLELMANFGDIPPRLPPPSDWATYDYRLVTTYRVLKARLMPGLHTPIAEHPMQLLAWGAMQALAPSTQLVLRGNTALRRGMRYPTNYTTRLHMQVQTVPPSLIPVVQLTEFAPPPAVGDHVLQFPSLAGSVADLTLTMTFPTPSDGMQALWHREDSLLTPAQWPAMPTPVVFLPLTVTPAPTPPTDPFDPRGVDPPPPYDATVLMHPLRNPEFPPELGGSGIRFSMLSVVKKDKPKKKRSWFTTRKPESITSPEQLEMQSLVTTLDPQTGEMRTQLARRESPVRKSPRFPRIRFPLLPNWETHVLQETYHSGRPALLPDSQTPIRKDGYPEGDTPPLPTVEEELTRAELLTDSAAALHSAVEYVLAREEAQQNLAAMKSFGLDPGSWDLSSDESEEGDGAADDERKLLTTRTVTTPPKGWTMLPPLYPSLERQYKKFSESQLDNRPPGEINGNLLPSTEITPLIRTPAGSSSTELKRSWWNLFNPLHFSN